MKTYMINEVFGPTLQGEGNRKGSVNHWVRFTACNLQCRKETEGFDCDTEFSGGYPMTAEDICKRLKELGDAKGVVLSGGEPGLQVDDALIKALHDAGWYIAIETNGTIALPKGIDWVSCSPKTAEHTLRVRKTYTKVNELRYVRGEGQALPRPMLRADHRYISPAFEPDGTVTKETMDWCIKLCLDSTRWDLSVQDHKHWGLR